MKFTSGSRKAWTMRKLPINKPRGTATRDDTMKPTITTSTLAHTCWPRVPSRPNRTAASTTAPGVGRNMPGTTPP
ncbi:hypothetical protein D3C73_1328040 [compost metagenome]